MNPQKIRGFTLVELLVVMTLIVILAGLIIAVVPIVYRRQATTRAENEIKAISSALENFKSENGAYPDDALLGAGAYTKNYTDNLDARTANDPTVTTGTASYSYANLVLYRALSGDRDLSRKSPGANNADLSLDLDGNSLGSPLASPPTSYYNFPASMLLPSGGTGKVTGIADPFGYLYGYSTAYQGDVLLTGTNPPPSHGYNPTFDLWSTGGQVVLTTDTQIQIQQKRAKWIYNWQNSGANIGQ